MKKDAKMTETKPEDAKLDIDESNQKDCKDRKRKRSSSPAEVHQAFPVPCKSEEEPDFDECAVILSYCKYTHFMYISEQLPLF